MTVADVGPFRPEALASPAVFRTREGSSFATIAQRVREGNLAAARDPLPMAPGASNGRDLQVVSEMLADGQLALARVALNQLSETATAVVTPDARMAPTVAPVAAATSMSKIAAVAVAPAASVPPVAASTHAPMIVDDVGTPPPLPPGVTVADVMLALANGNGGSIPADTINLYGPGGLQYDPAAIMDAYRASAIGQAQMSAHDWIGKA